MSAPPLHGADAASPAPPAERAADAVVTTIPRAMRRIRAIARSEAGGMSVPQFRALRYLDRNPGAGLTSLADHLGVSLPAASALVGRLVAAGFVSRELDPAERRRITMDLTDRGRARSAAASDAVRAWWTGRLAGLSPDALATVVDAMALLDAALADAGDQPDAATASVALEIA